MAQIAAYSPRPMSQILAIPADDEDPTKSKTPEDKGADKKDKTEEDLPEKYRGKSARDIAEMHRNAEQRLGQLQNEVGQLRGLVSTLSEIQRPAPTVTDEKPVDVSSDELLDNPAEAIRRVIQPELQKRDQAAASSDAERTLMFETNKLVSDFPDLEQVAASPEFQQFAHRTSSRRADLDLAANGKGLDQVRAARRLMEDYTDFQELTTQETKNEETKETPASRAAKVATEGPAGGGKQGTKDLVYESEVLEVLEKNPTKYRSPKFQSDLRTAIKEGRYVQNG